MVSTLAATLLAAAVVAPAPPATVKDGVDAWQRGDYARAVSTWRLLAEQGDPDAAFNLAQAYKLGRGVPSDLAQAKLWYGKAAQAGHPQATANYGLLLFQDGDRKAAMPWIEKASAAGDPRAQYVYGTALFNGDLAPRDWPRAYALMARAASAGLPQATTSLAQMDQYISADERRAGLAMAAEMAALPLPPTERHLVGDSSPRATSSPAPAPAPAKAPAPKPPGGSARASAPVPLAAKAGGRWQVQLGAFGSEGHARTAWSNLCQRSASLRVLQPAYLKAGAIIRLRAGPLADRIAARQACSAARLAGSPCMLVPPNGPEQA